MAYLIDSDIRALAIAYRNFTARSLLGLLLNFVEKHNPPPCVKDVEDAVDVAATFLSQFPQAVRNVTRQRFTGLNIAGRVAVQGTMRSGFVSWR